MMRSRLLTLVALCFTLAPALAQAQQRDTAQTRRPAGQRVASSSSTGVTPNRDVILEIPELSVDSIGLTVQDVRAHVSLDANAMNFVQITAGVDVEIRKVQLSITGVLAEAYLCTWTWTTCAAQRRRSTLARASAIRSASVSSSGMPTSTVSGSAPGRRTMSTSHPSAGPPQWATAPDLRCTVRMPGKL
jgi:hypothetical protein